MSAHAYRYDEQEMLRGIAQWRRENAPQPIEVKPELPKYMEIPKKPVQSFYVVPDIPLPKVIKPSTSPTQLLGIAATYFGVSKEEILKRNNEWKSCHRRYACYLILREQDYSFPCISRVFKQHHTTCISGFERAHYLLKSDPNFVQTVNDLKRLIKR